MNKMAASTERRKDPYEMGFLLAPRVPQGLAAVVESLTREVLRQRPEDIYVFAARHFEKLLTLREKYDVVDKKPNKEEYNNFANIIKKRNDCKESRKSKRITKDIGDCTSKDGNWSLKETAKVLERHRNIFGDGEKRISTEEVRALANENTNLRTSSSIGIKNKRGKRRTSDTSEEYSKDTLKTITDNKDSSRFDRSSKTLKIISQIPTVLTRNTGTKDIKMELRKNRLSGSLREKSTDSSNDGQYYEQISDISRKSSSSKTELAASVEHFEEERIKKRTTNRRRSESVERNSSRSSRSRKRKDSLTELLPDKKELSKTRSMDQVKEYVVRTFGSIKNIDQLDTSYVNQVQNVIDRSVPIIKDKVDELKNDVLSKKSKMSSLNNELLKKRDTRPNTSESDTRSNDDREKHHSKRSSSADSTDFRKQQDDTLENRLINTQNILKDIISSKCYTKCSNINYRSKSNNGHSNEQDNRYSILDENCKIILPAVRPASSKNSKCLSRSDSNNLILPPISPDTGKISKKKDDMILPTLSTITVDTSVSSSSLRSEEKENNSVDKIDDNLGDDILQLSTSIKEDISSTRKMLENVNDVLKAPITFIDNNKMIEEMSSKRNTTIDDQGENFLQETNDNLNEILGEQILEMDVNVENEICKDSLNVTPDIIDIPPSPDSLEPFIENHHLSTVEEETELKDKFIKIEEIESNVDKVIDSFEDSIEVKSPEPMIVEVLDDSIVEKPEEPIKQIEIIKVTSDLDFPKEISSSNIEKSNDDKSTEHKLENESDNVVEILQLVITNDDKSTGQMEKDDKSEINKSENEMTNIKEMNETIGDEEIINEQENSSLSSKENKLINNLHISLSKEVPFSYILTEGSPVEIPDFVTTVIIPERSPSTPESNLDNNNEEEEEEEEKDVELREERQKRAVESFGEYIRPEQIECSTVDIDFIRGIKASHDIAIIRQDLDGIKEEEEYDEEKQIKSMDEENKNDENIKKDHSPLLEHISETEENETDENDKCENKIIPVLEIEIKSENRIDDKEEPNENVNVIENLLECEESTETADVTSESTNEVKETTITDRSTDSLSLDPARPIVPELNLDSLRDITISSFKINDADETVSLTEPTLSGKDKIDLEEYVLLKKNENFDNYPKEDDTSPMEMISMDEKPMETETSLIHLENEDISKEECSILSEEIITNEEEQLVVVSNETKIQSELTETIEQCDTIKNEFSPLEYLEIKKNTTDLDTEEEIAKELIEIDRAENRYLSQDTPIIISKDHLEDEPESEILNSNGAIEDREVLTIVEEDNIRCTNEKQDDNDSYRKNKMSNTSEENLKDITSVKDEEENISERIESTRSNDNEIGNDQSNASSINNVRSDTSVTAFEEIEAKEFDTKLTEKKEYHVYVTDLKETENQEEDSSKSSNMTFHSAVTKIQAGIRGFLTRKKLQENYPHGSTLDSIPSIQESVAEEPLVADLQSVSEEMADSLIKSALSSAMTSENVTTVEEKEKLPLIETISMPTKHRQCLRREDAIQKNTLSMENAFTSCGIQHTGEFHDCLPLPVLESTEMTKSNILSQNKDKDENIEEKLIDQNKFEKCTKEENIPESSTDLTLESNEHNNDDIIENIDRTSSNFEKDLNNLFGGLHPKDLAKFLVSQVNTPIMLGLVDIVPNSVLGTNPNVIFETNANLNVNDDGTRSTKDDSTLQNRYLNFITSVEDNEPSHVMETLKEYKDHSTEHSIQSLREPLALPGTSEGVLIEELSSLDNTTMSKLQDVSLNPINLESTTMDCESIEKSIDSENSTEVLEKSDDVDVQTPITVKREENITQDDLPIVKENVTPTCTKTLTMFSESDERTEISISSKEDKIENKKEMIKDNADQLVVNENIDNTNGKTIEQSMSISENEEIENNENRKENSNDEDENNIISSDDKDENNEASSIDKDENKEINLSDKDKNKEASSDDKDENKETSSDDNDENKETNSDEKTKNLDNSKNEENKSSSETMQVCLNDSVDESDDKKT